MSKFPIPSFSQMYTFFFVCYPDVRKDVPQLPKAVFQVYAPNKKCYLKLIVSITSDTGYWKGVNYLVEINFPSSKPNDYPIVPPKCKFMPGFQVCILCSPHATN